MKRKIIKKKCSFELFLEKTEADYMDKDINGKYGVYIMPEKFGRWKCAIKLYENAFGFRFSFQTGHIKNDYYKKFSVIDETEVFLQEEFYWLYSTLRNIKDRIALL